MTTNTISVDLGDRGYDIIVGTNLLAKAGSHMAPLVKRQPAIIVTDETVAALHLATLRDSLSAVGMAAEIVVLKPGESTKEFSGLEFLSSAILDLAPERASTLIALGGGVVGDITGFAASVILRGIDFIQIPTTLLSQVDSSVGGKTGINTRHGKNLIGSFYQPRLVLADTGVLDTLPRRELLAGYAEVVKYGLLGYPDFFTWLEANGRAVLDGDADARRHAVITSCDAKAKIVAGDERELGQRALLNLGHTFAHTLEAETGFGSRLLHGEAVSIGMILAFDLSTSLGLCPAEDTARVKRHFAAVGLPMGLDAVAGQDWSSKTLINHMRLDKKVRDGRITFILARGIGDAFIANDVSLKDVEALLDNAIAA
ncbi:MAG: 3-dehydroquinate synthase [Proteobacteria bacterium]|nr:3-dehydroquinate synthase [Pseudomonadota bacterium]MDA1323653.1 3-dehydroquinate synthase [Pseudomonadota bacterium]